MNRVPIFKETLRTVLTALIDADGTNAVSVFSAGMNGSLIDRIVLSNTQASPNVEVSLLLSTDGANFFKIGSHTLAGAVTEAVDETELLLMTQDVNGFALFLATGVSLYVQLDAALAASERLAVSISGGDY